MAVGLRNSWVLSGTTVVAFLAAKFHCLSSQVDRGDVWESNSLAEVTGGLKTIKL